MLEEFKNPKTTKTQIRDLQALLVQTIIDYCNSNNITEVDEVHFNVNGLSGDSYKYSKWMPSTDSYIELIGLEEENGYRVRRFIGDYC